MVQITHPDNILQAAAPVGAQRPDLAKVVSVAVDAVLVQVVQVMLSQAM
jgi:hypothetical protein